MTGGIAWLEGVLSSARSALEDVPIRHSDPLEANGVPARDDKHSHADSSVGWDEEPGGIAG